MFIQESFQKYPRACRLIIFCLAAAGLGYATPYWLYSSDQVIAGTSTAPVEAGSQPLNGTLQKGTPEYDTVLPAGKSIRDYGGWTRVSPPNRDPVFAYTDTIGAIPINVSQQPLPKDFADQPEQQVQEFAANYAATKKLNVTDATAFIGNSAKGPQSVIIVMNDLLILIKASAAIPDQDWKIYIESLQ